MSLLVSIDPGTSKGHAVATFAHRTLRSVLRARPDAGCYDYGYDDDDHLSYGAVAQMVVEMPDTVFAGTNRTVIELARAAERSVAYYTVHHPGTVKYVAPRHWKHGKKVSHQYNIWCALRSEEQQVLADSTNQTCDKIADTLKFRCVKYSDGKKPTQFVLGDMIDAIGLGLHSLKRIDKLGRVLEK